MNQGRVIGTKILVCRLQEVCYCLSAVKNIEKVGISQTANLSEFCQGVYHLLGGIQKDTLTRHCKFGLQMVMIAKFFYHSITR